MNSQAGKHMEMLEGSLLEEGMEAPHNLFTLSIFYFLSVLPLLSCILYNKPVSG
jgi:hypothetical protein